MSIRNIRNIEIRNIENVLFHETAHAIMGKDMNAIPVVREPRTMFVDLFLQHSPRTPSNISHHFGD
jgi:hypothetical protein